MNNYRYSEKGIALTKQFEGCRLKAYPDPATGGDPWTIGYGHTGGDVYKGLSITQERADELLGIDIQRFSDHVNRVVSVAITQNQFDALVDFAFNVGCGNLDKSTLLKKVNNSDFIGASLEFDKWVFAGGKILPGLIKRRGAEKSLFIFGG